MKINYFDLPYRAETIIEMAWPMQPLAFNWNHQNDTVRMYYTELHAAERTKLTFYMIASEQELPATFPGKYLATVQTENLDERHDAAIHIFIQPPVNKPAQPKIIEQPEVQ